jgi:WD40 repeat protein/DNA-binding SARP family transcriptional activator
MEQQTDTQRRRQRAARVAERTRVLVLGPLLIEHDGTTVHVAGTHRRRLFALLASRAGRVVGVDAIVEALWGEEPPPTAAKTIQSHVARLRSSLSAVGRELIETTPGGYRLRAEGVEVDADVFDRLTSDGHRRVATGDLTGAVSVLTEALAMWRGSPYADFPDSEFAVHERTRLVESHATAREDLAETQVESGATSAATGDLERLVGEHPGRERAWGLLMRAQYAAGRQHDALVAFQRARRALADEFGLDPGPELRSLERMILEQDPELTVASRFTVPVMLRVGPEALVGRATELAWLTEAWKASRQGRGQLCVLLGPPDSGRTRLAAQLAAVAAGDHAAVLYTKAADGLAATTGTEPGVPPPPAEVVEAIVERSRRQPVVLVVDDVEWASAATMDSLAALVAAIEQLAAMVVLVADPAGGGPAVEALGRLDPSGGRTLHVAPLPDEEIARLVAADGIDDPAAVAAIVSVAGGSPGAASREAAAWAEQAAGERLNRAAAASASALAAADGARDSVVEEVARLVRARARRHQLASEAWLGRQPYRGLSSYGPMDADVFVGRERLVAELATRVLDRRVVIVTGASGSGKSSLARAGLIPLVQSGRLPGEAPWRVNVAVPGEDPLRALDELADLDEPGAQLIVVDQFEETFVSTPAVVDRLVGRLLDLALDPALDAHIVLVVRADHYGRLAEARHVTELVEDAPVLVGRPSDEELRRIIEEPAVRAGCRVEPALVAAVLADVGDADGALPLVSTAMAELWEQRVGDELTVDQYQALGGVEASVERLGARVLDAVGGGAGEEAVRRALLLMADVTDDGSWVRRRVKLADVPDELVATIDSLVSGRLVVRDGDSVEIVHEVAFRAWPRLRAWLEAARSDLVLGRDLRIAARTWTDHGRSDDDVYRGARLAAAIEWCERHPESVTPSIEAFVAAATAVADRGRLEAEAQLTRERRAGRRLRRALVAASILLVASLVAGLLAVRQADRADRTAELAEREAERAEREAERADRTAEGAAESAAAAELAAERADQAANAADARRVGTQALVTENVDGSLLMAVAGVRLDDSSDTRANLLTALTRNPALVAASRSAEPLLTVDASFDGKVVAVGGPFRGIAFHDAATLVPLGSFPDPPFTLKFQPGGTTLAMAANPFNPNGSQQLDPVPVVIVDAATFEPASTQLRGQPARATVWSLEYSANGRYLAVAFELYGDDPDAQTGGAVVVWDLEAPGQPVRRFDAASVHDFGWVGLSPDGALLYTGGTGGASLVVRDVETGTLVDSVTIAHIGGEVSPDGAVVAVADGRDVVLLDAATLTELRRLEGQADVTTLQFSRDGTRFATGTEDGAVTLWDVATGAVVDQFRGHSTFVRELAFSPDGATLYTVAQDRSFLAWDLDGSRRFVAEHRAPATPANADYAIVAPSGERVTYVSGLSGQPDAMQFLDLTANEMSPLIEVGHGGIGDVRPRPPGFDQVATSGRDGFVRIWERSTGRLISERDVDGDRIAYSADGERILVGAADGEVAVIDADTLEPLAPPIQLDHRVVRLQASPDNRTAIALTSAPPGIALVDTIDGTVLHQRRIELDPISADFSPDGERAAIALQTGEVGVLDVSTAEWVRAPLDGHHSTAITVRYSPDGDTLVSGGLDGRVALWDGNTGALLGSVVASPNVATAAGFAPDGHTVVIASTDGTVARWDTQVEQWISAACAIAGRSVTPAEWAAILPNRPFINTCP